MRQEDHALLEPGMRVRVGPKLMGAELYGADDPDEFRKWLGQEVTVRSVSCPGDEWFVEINEDDRVAFYLEEIESIIEDTEIEETTASVDDLLGGIL